MIIWYSDALGQSSVPPKEVTPGPGPLIPKNALPTLAVKSTYPTSLGLRILPPWGYFEPQDFVEPVFRVP